MAEKPLDIKAMKQFSTKNFKEKEMKMSLFLKALIIQVAGIFYCLTSCGDPVISQEKDAENILSSRPWKYTKFLSYRIKDRYLDQTEPTHTIQFLSNGRGKIFQANPINTPPNKAFIEYGEFSWSIEKETNSKALRELGAWRLRQNNLIVKWNYKATPDTIKTTYWGIMKLNFREFQMGNLDGHGIYGEYYEGQPNI